MTTENDLADELNQVQVASPVTFERQMTDAAVEAGTDEIVVPRTGLAIEEPHEVTPRRIAHVRRRLTTIRQQVDDLYLETGQLLREAHENRYYTGWGFDSFEQYAESELRMRRRKAYYLISVAEAFSRLAIGPGEREGITLSNAVAIAAATRDPETGLPREVTPEQREELLNQARTMTARELRETLRNERGLPPIQHVARNFAVQTDQALVVDQALEAARVAAGAQEDELSRGRLLELICAEYLAGTAGIMVNRAEAPRGEPTLETAVARARESLHDLSALDPDGMVLATVIDDVAGALVCPSCGAPFGGEEIHAEVEAEGQPAPILQPRIIVETGDLFVRTAVN